jgi:Zn finger protein HypA/HybF involved in hydrogenase expression
MEGLKMKCELCDSMEAEETELGNLCPDCYQVQAQANFDLLFDDPFIGEI